MRRTTAMLLTISATAAWLLGFQPARAVVPSSWSGTIQYASFLCSVNYDREWAALCPLDPTRPTNNMFTSARDIPTTHRNGHSLVRLTLPQTFTQADGSAGSLGLTFGNPANPAAPFSTAVARVSSGSTTICIPAGMTSFYVFPDTYRGFKQSLAWSLSIVGTC
jgi:hypothetical protein